MKSNQLIEKINGGEINSLLEKLYGAEAIEAQKARYIKAIGEFESIYGEGRDLSIYSVAGRSELSGNHTDHNHGRVIAASIDLDIIAVASPNGEDLIRVKSEGFHEDVIDINVFTSPRENPDAPESDW